MSTPRVRMPTTEIVAHGRLRAVAMYGDPTMAQVKESTKHIIRMLREGWAFSSDDGEWLPPGHGYVDPTFPADAMMLGAGGRTFIRLATPDGTLAMYRLYANGHLERLSKWPSEWDDLPNPAWPGDTAR